MFFSTNVLTKLNNSAIIVPDEGSSNLMDEIAAFSEDYLML